MKSIKVEIPLDYLENFGTACLTGRMIGENPEVPLGDINDVVFVIHQTSMDWKRRHNGPYMSVVPEYIFECLVEDVVNLVNRGIKFRFEHKIVEPK